jgi:hypothetical protein
MTRKQRIPNLDVQRNGLTIGVPGDKFYRNPACTDGFYKMEGVMPGSTFYYQKEKNKFGRTLSRKACPFYDTHDFGVKSLEPSKLWKNKVAKDTLDHDSLYVKTLTQWDKDFMKNVKPIKDTKTPIKTNAKHPGKPVAKPPVKQIVTTKKPAAAGVKK